MPALKGSVRRLFSSPSFIACLCLSRKTHPLRPDPWNSSVLFPLVVRSGLHVASAFGLGILPSIVFGYISLRLSGPCLALSSFPLFHGGDAAFFFDEPGTRGSVCQIGRLLFSPAPHSFLPDF